MLTASNGALLVAAFAKLAAQTLSQYHATIVLNLSWIIFLGALSSAVTLSLAAPLRNESNFAAWFRFLLSPIRPMSRLSMVQTASFTVRWDRGVTNGVQNRNAGITRTRHQHALFLTMHMIGIGFFGISLFFGLGIFAFDCDTYIVFSLFNVLFSRNDPKFEDFWSGVYVLCMFPFVNLFLATLVVSLLVALPWWIALSTLRRINPRLGQSKVVNRIGVVLPFLVAIPLLIVSTEKTISANILSGAVSDGENEWGFGQMLALVVLVVPAFETWERINAIRSPRAPAFPNLPSLEEEAEAGHGRRLQSARALADERRQEWGLELARDLAVIPAAPEYFPFRSGTQHVPVVKTFCVIPDTTISEVFGVIVPTGMRKDWDEILDYDGVLRRYDSVTAQRYAVLNTGPLFGGTPFVSCDAVMVQRVERQGESITVTNASMVGDDMPTATDAQPPLPGHLRATLRFEGWTIATTGTGVGLTCVAQAPFADMLPLAARRDLVRQIELYPKGVHRTLSRFGFAPVWGSPGEPADHFILEVERMDTDSGTYTATFRTRAAGSVPVVYDTLERWRYKSGAHTSWEVVEGRSADITCTEDKNAGTLSFQVAAAGMLVQLTVNRRIKVLHDLV